MAFYPLKPYEWIEEEKNWRWRSHHLKNGVVVEVASVETPGDFGEFIERIRQQTVSAVDFDRRLTVSYESLAGDSLRFTYDGPRILNGKSFNLAETRLFDGPFISADVGSGLIDLRSGGRVRILDFQKVEIREQ